tara:strand:+ start:2382 stop:3068 length:687 start_codon:yes stop_codon:yes gene_type:complete
MSKLYTILKEIDLLREQGTIYPKTLRVLDFDHTLAFTGEMVYVRSPEEEIVEKLSSEEYSHHSLSRDEIMAGYYYDFSEFDQVDSKKARENTYVTNILKNFINAGNPSERIILILTARNQDAEEGIRNYLETIGISHGSIKVVGVGSSAPQKKVDEVNRILISHPSISEVSFFDDSLANTDEMMRFLNTYKNDLGDSVLFDIAQVDKEGKLIRRAGYRKRRRDVKSRR